MNHAELIDKVMQETSLSRRKSAKLVRDTIDCIKETIKSGETVKIAGLGTFKKLPVAEKKGVAPNGKEIVIPAHSRVKFTPAKAFKDELK